MDFVSPSRVLPLLYGKKSGEICVGNLKYLARLYVNFAVPESIASLDPSWPTSVLFSGYTPFRRYYEMYVQILMERVATDGLRKESLVELIKLYMQMNTKLVANQPRFWDVFDQQCDYSVKLEEMTSMLGECLRLSDDGEARIIGQLKQWEHEISREMGTYGNAPTYEMILLEDLAGCCDQNVSPSPGRGTNYNSIGEKFKLEQMGLYQRGMRELLHQPRRAVVTLKRFLKESSRGIADFQLRGSAILGLMNAYQNHMLDDPDGKCAEECYKMFCSFQDENDSYVVRMDREYESILEYGCGDIDHIVAIEEKAYNGSPKACLHLHDHYLSCEDENRCMADFWWRLRERHLRQAVFEDVRIAHEFDD